MKYILSFQLAVMSFLVSKSQTTTLTNENQTIKIQEFKNALNRQFTKVTTGTAFGNMGNFVSVGSDSKSLSLNGSIVSKNSSVWSFELAGGATEGVFRIFNNEELNSNFSGELKYHKLSKIHFGARNSFDVSEIDDQILELNNQFLRDSLAIEHKKELYKIQIDITAAETKIAELQKQIEKIKTQIDTTASVKVKDSLEIVKGSLSYELESNHLGIKLLKAQLKKIQTNVEDFFDEALESRTQLRDKKVAELIKKKQNLDLQGFDFIWFSFGWRARNNEIKLFKPNNLPIAQFSDTSFVSQRFTASISRYRSTSFQNQDVFWTAGIFFDYTTNFNTLKKVEIEERNPINGNPEQVLKKIINAYQGEYKEALFEINLFYDYYRFFGQFNSLFGIHVNPSINYSETIKKPISNLLMGIIVPFGDKEKQSSKVNVEIFYNRQDVFNYLNRETKLSSFGVRATFPFNVINFKL